MNRLYLFNRKAQFVYQCLSNGVELSPRVKKTFKDLIFYLAKGKVLGS